MLSFGGQSCAHTGWLALGANAAPGPRGPEADTALLHFYAPLSSLAPSTLVLSCPAISSLCLGTGHLPAEVGGTCWTDAAVWLLELFQMPGQCPTHQQGSMKGPRADPLLPSRKTQLPTRAGGKQEGKATPSPRFRDKTADREGRPGPGTSESPPAQVCPWWR